MESDTEKKLTELQHQHELLRTDMETNVKTMKAHNEATLAKNESAIDRLRTDIEKALGGLRTDNERAVGGLRTDMEKNVNSITMRVIGVVGFGVAFLAIFIAILQFFI